MLEKNPEWEKELTDNDYAFVKLLQLQKYSCFSYEDIHKLYKSRRVFIYGAGKYGKKAFAECIKMNIPIENFIVSSLENNTKMLFGCKIISLDEMQNTESLTVIIAIANKETQRQVAEKIKNKGVQDIIYMI